LFSLHPLFAPDACCLDFRFRYGKGDTTIFYGDGHLIAVERKNLVVLTGLDLIKNVFVERLWRSVKYENVYLQDYQSVPEARIGFASYFQYYNTKRPHQALGYKTPHEVHYAQ
jgi:hypothetical protein